MPFVGGAESYGHDDGDEHRAPPTGYKRDFPRQQDAEKRIDREVHGLVEGAEGFRYSATRERRYDKYDPRPQQRGQPSSNLQAGSGIAEA
jgi:hypothetical protein